MKFDGFGVLIAMLYGRPRVALDVCRFLLRPECVKIGFI
jgi:hypothetical protein